jgi:biopolymer transport protein ExbD
MGAIYQKKRKRIELNLVPLIDVLVMLIFFAFVTMQFRSVTTMNLTLPKVETAGKSELKDSVTISITKEGEFYFNEHPAKVEELEQLIAKVAGVTKDITVLIRSDENTPLRHITAAMDLCRKKGLNKIRLQSK